MGETEVTNELPRCCGLAYGPSVPQHTPVLPLVSVSRPPLRPLPAASSPLALLPLLRRTAPSPAPPKAHFSVEQTADSVPPEPMAAPGRVQVLQTSLDEVARQLRLLRRRKDAEARAEQRLWQTACLVRWLAPGAPEAAVAFLEKHRPEDGTERAQWARQLEVAETSTTAEERARLTTFPGSVQERRRLKRAQAWLHEFRLHNWIDDLNVRKGIAPVTAVVLEELQRRVSAAPEPGRLPLKGKHREQWLRRWRRRWGIRLARLLPGERLPPDACVRKAPATLAGDPWPSEKVVWGPSVRAARQGGPESPLRRPGRKMGPTWWPQNGGRLLCGRKDLGPQNGPLFRRVRGPLSPRRRPPCGPSAVFILLVCIWRRRELLTTKRPLPAQAASHVPGGRLKGNRQRRRGRCRRMRIGSRGLCRRRVREALCRAVTYGRRGAPFHVEDLHLLGLLWRHGARKPRKFRDPWPG